MGPSFLNCTEGDQLNIKFANLKFPKIENEPVFLIFTVRLVIGRRDYFLVFQNDRSLVFQNVLFGVLEWAVSGVPILSYTYKWPAGIQS